LLYAAKRFKYPLVLKHDERLIKNKEHVRNMPYSATQPFENRLSDLELYNKYYRTYPIDVKHYDFTIMLKGSEKAKKVNYL